MLKVNPEPDHPYLSIIIPVYNGKRFIRDTLASLVIFQKSAARGFEIIFQNALSSDGTTAIIDAFCSDNPNFHHFNEKDNGQSDAINKGVSRAKGEWVTWLCADDIVLPNLWNALQDADQTKADIVYGDVIFIINGQLIPAVGTETHTPGKLAKDRLIIQQPGTCIRRSVWKEINGLNSELNWMMDYDLFLRLESMDRRFLRLKQFIAAAKIHKDAKTSSGSIKRLLEIWSIIFRNHLRNIQFFRLKPYYVYFLEYIIKRIESQETFSGAWLKLLNGLHRVFWAVCVPIEKDEIESRFQKIPQEVSSFVERFRG